MRLTRQIRKLQKTVAFQTFFDALLKRDLSKIALSNADQDIIAALVLVLRKGSPWCQQRFLQWENEQKQAPKQYDPDDPRSFSQQGKNRDNGKNRGIPKPKTTGDNILNVIIVILTAVLVTAIVFNYLKGGRI